MYKYMYSILFLLLLLLLFSPLSFASASESDLQKVQIINGQLMPKAQPINISNDKLVAKYYEQNRKKDLLILSNAVSLDFSQQQKINDLFSSRVSLETPFYMDLMKKTSDLNNMLSQEKKVKFSQKRASKKSIRIAKKALKLVQKDTSREFDELLTRKQRRIHHDLRERIYYYQLPNEL